MTHLLALPPSDDSAPAADRDAATKAAVLSVAERLFAVHGFRNVSVRDITAEAGVNLASVNYHFGSKDALVFEIFADAPRSSAASVRACCTRRRAGTPAGRRCGRSSPP